MWRWPPIWAVSRCVPGPPVAWCGRLGSPCHCPAVIPLCGRACPGMTLRCLLSMGGRLPRALLSLRRWEAVLYVMRCWGGEKGGNLPRFLSPRVCAAVPSSHWVAPPAACVRVGSVPSTAVPLSRILRVPWLRCVSARRRVHSCGGVWGLCLLAPATLPVAPCPALCLRPHRRAATGCPPEGDELGGKRPFSRGSVRACLPLRS